MDYCHSDSVQGYLKELVHLYFVKIYNQMESYGLHPGQVAVMKALDRKEGMSQRELADILHIKPPTVAVSIKRMEKNGFIERKPDEKDQRITRIYLTQYGKKINQEIVELLQKNEEELFQGFEEGEKYLFKRFFKQMIENLRMSMPKDAKEPDVHFHGMYEKEKK
ncbi:MAG: MarR family transcriptional regulator [Firmicutes bacterium]|uniref:MarR family transcriptional regulator n=1 Tax=Candidatus Scybalomonas excrementavium TaxID=2840943 RepID=A0A9D9I2D3_9FIRM|nr:MarR family transcriptional regulator [Candidatus Scybalomonas excrementavium]